MRKVSVVVALFVLVAAGVSPAWGQRPEGNALEIAVLAGYTNLAPERGDNETIFGLPSGGGVNPVSPMLRLTVWSSSTIYEFGFSFVSVSEDNQSLSVLNAEGGFGMTFGPTESKSIPFVTGVAGLLTVSNGGSESVLYLGGIAGLRYAFNEHAISRIQFGFRHFMSDALNINHTIEIAVGVGVVL